MMGKKSKTVDDSGSESDSSSSSSGSSSSDSSSSSAGEKVQVNGKTKKSVAKQVSGNVVQYTDMDKFVPRPVRKLENGLGSREELWLITVPADFDADLLDGCKIPLGKSMARVDDDFVCLKDDVPNTQLQVLLASGKHDNGLAFGKKISKSFQVVNLPKTHNVNDDGEGERGDNSDVEDSDANKLSKIQEVVNQLKSQPRPQIAFKSVYTHLGENDGAENVGDEDESDDDSKKRKKLKSSKKPKKKSKR